MLKALEESKQAYRLGEVPIGAVIVKNQKIIATAHNATESSNNPTAHAELLCIQRAAKILGDWRLNGCILYCTLEPCAMCAGAILESRLDELIYGAPDLRCGADGSWKNLFDGTFPIHSLKVTSGLMADESAKLMRAFFKERRDARRNDCSSREKAV